MNRMPHNQQQMRMEMTAEQKERMRAQRLQTLNPFPNDNTLVPTLREIQQCPIAAEQKQMTMFITKLLEVGNSDLVPLISEGISSGLNSEFVCRKLLQERTVVRMEEDESLKEKLSKLKETENLVLELQNELDHAAKEMEELSKGMWMDIVKSYGLAVDQRCYVVNEDDGCVKQVSLDCANCSCKESMQSVRNKMTKSLFELQKPKSEKND